MCLYVWWYRVCWYVILREGCLLMTRCSISTSLTSTLLSDKDENSIDQLVKSAFHYSSVCQ